jgi:hypothetical protein
VSVGGHVDDDDDDAGWGKRLIRPSELSSNLPAEISGSESEERTKEQELCLSVSSIRHRIFDML